MGRHRLPCRTRVVDILIAARIVVVLDVFDILTQDRPYPPAWSLDRTLDESMNGERHGLRSAHDDGGLRST